MKKNILLTISFVAMLMIACSNSTPTFEVEVVENLGYDKALCFVKVLTKTQSGEQIESKIDESLLYNNKIPFRAIMQKNEIGKFGYIKDSTDSETFDVIVAQNLGYDNVISSHKIIAVTKSGIQVECRIDEEVLLKNKIPFRAKMQKNSIGIYGYIE